MMMFACFGELISYYIPLLQPKINQPNNKNIDLFAKGWK